MNFHDFGSELLSMLVKGFILGAMLLLGGLLLQRNSSARTLSFYWRVALLSLLLLPAVSLLFRGIEFPNLAREEAPLVSTEPTVLEANPSESATAPSAAIPKTPSTAIPTPEQTSTWFSLPNLMISLWLFGALLILGRWVVAQVKLKSWIKAGQDVNLQFLAQQGVPTNLRVKIVDQASAPMVWGLWKPLVILPSAAHNWSPAQWTLVLNHEMTHVKRADALFLFVTRLAVALHWVNPFAWLASKQLQLADERVADDTVLEKGAAPDEYAQVLVDFARSAHQGTLAPSMAKPSTVRMRVARILDRAQNRSHPALATRLSFLALLSACLFAAGGAYIGSAVAQTKPPKAAEAKPPKETAKQKATKKKLKEIIVNQLLFEFTALNDATDFLVHVSKQQDKAKKGITIKLADKKLAERRIQAINLQKIPLSVALQFVTRTTNTAYTINAEGEVVIMDAKAAAPGKPAKPKKDGPGAKKIKEKLEAIVYSSISFDGSLVSEAVEYIRITAPRLDITEFDPQKKGINLIIKKPKDPNKKGIESIELGKIEEKDMTLGDLLKRIAKDAGATIEVHEYAVVLVPKE